MKLFRTLFLTTTIIGSTLVNAATSHFEVTAPSTSPYYMFPGLDLNNIEKIELTTTTSGASSEYSVDRMELHFLNAKNLEVTHFKALPGSNRFYATVSNGWVFRKLNVELEIPAHKPISGDPINVNVYIATIDDFNTDYTPNSPSEQLLHAHGTLIDVTPNIVADTHWMEVDNKGLDMKLYQRPENDLTPPNPRSGFKLYMNWMGHGERTAYLATPFPHYDYDRFKAVAMNFLPTPTGDDHEIEIEFEDEFGNRQSAIVGELRLILNEAYNL